MSMCLGHALPLVSESHQLCLPCQRQRDLAPPLPITAACVEGYLSLQLPVECGHQ